MHDTLTGDENTFVCDTPPPSSPQHESPTKSFPLSPISEPRRRRKEPEALDIARPGKKRRCAPALPEQVPAVVEQLRNFGPGTIKKILNVKDQSKHNLHNFVVSNMGWKQSVGERIAISQAWTEFEQEELVMSGLPQQQLSKPHAEGLVVFALNCDTMPRISPSGFRVADSSTREGSPYCPA